MPIGAEAMMSRRNVLTMAASVASGLATDALRQKPAKAAFGTGGFWTAGRIPYGACTRPDPLQKDPSYQAALRTYCQQLTPEGGLFWIVLRPSPDQFNFADADAVLAFAEANNMTMRGHTLVWYGAMPEWTKDISSAHDAEREMTIHIERVVSRYRGKIKTWHVVNEPIDDPKGVVPGLRPSIWLQYLGDRYIDMAFQLAHRVDPAAKLLINEYDLESVNGTAPKKRQAFLQLIRDLVGRGVPLHGVGLQGHIMGQDQIDREGVSSFVSEIKSLGLSVDVTELDVIDHDLPGPIDARDGIVATRAYDFLDSIFAAARPEIIATWGITDRHTWVPIYNKRADGLPNRPLPLDENYRPKPLWSVIDYFCNRTV
jgi:endo-1,4-beta-xylanase